MLTKCFPFFFFEFISHEGKRNGFRLRVYIVITLSKITAVGLIFLWGLLPFHSLKYSLAPLILRGRHLEFVTSI